MKYPGLRLGFLSDHGEFVPGQPIVQRIDARRFMLRAPYAAMWDGGQHVVEEGFPCDLASIPRAFHVLIPKGGMWDGPSVHHDDLYTRRTWTRKRADDFFLAGLKAVGVGWLTRNTMYAAVRAFGWYLWNT